MEPHEVSSATHWETIYRSRSDADLSWTQTDPATSLALISHVCAAGRVIDVGGGTSTLADRLLERGHSVAVLDLSSAALQRSRQRLGERANDVRWIVADVTVAKEVGEYDVWHDRAVFHFLTNAADRRRYADLMVKSVVAGGHAVIATFALDGPEKCSGLEVRRYDGQMLAREIGPAFELLKTIHDTHVTPWGKPQAFQYSMFRRAG